MATFKLGAIITDIAGSVGGTTLKRNGSYKVIMNKSGGSPYSRLLRNQALAYLGNIFKAWAYLTDSEKSQWNALALDYTFPDKFGTLRNLSGRQLFIKLNGQNYQVNQTILDPSTINSDITVFTAQNFTYLTAFSSLSLQFVQDFGVTSTFLISFEISLNPLHAPTYVSRKISVQLVLTGDSVVQVKDYILETFPYWTRFYYSRVYVTSINSSGFKSVMQSVDMLVNP